MGEIGPCGKDSDQQNRGSRLGLQLGQPSPITVAPLVTVTAFRRFFEGERVIGGSRRVPARLSAFANPPARRIATDSRSQPSTGFHRNVDDTPPIPCGLNTATGPHAARTPLVSVLDASGQHGVGQLVQQRDRRVRVHRPGLDRQDEPKLLEQIGARPGRIRLLGHR